jgi:MFS family permease
MFTRIYLARLKDPVWARVTTISLTLFFIFLGDAILSFWVPNFIQDSLHSSIAMGFVLSFSSIVGFGSDMIFPQLLRGMSVGKLLFIAIITSLLFSLALFGSTFFPLVLVFLLAMALWGIYYEFVGFANHQFIADSIPHELHSSAWAVVSTFRNLAYFLGPMIGGWLVIRSRRSPLIMAVMFTLIGLFMVISGRKFRGQTVELNFSEVNLKKEIEHWIVLFRHVWPVVVLSLFLALIDSTFWTTGAVLTAELSEKAWYGALFLPFYTLPSLVAGYIVLKKKVAKGKKKLAIRFTLISGVFLALIGVFDSVVIELLMVLTSSAFLSFSYPLLDGAYSDIIARMGRERKHLIGLSNSAISLSYIVGPAIAGIITNFVGERGNFTVAGIATILVCIFLLVVTPKKLKLPQQEIKSWT